MDERIFSAGHMSGIYIHQYEENTRRRLFNICLLQSHRTTGFTNKVERASTKRQWMSMNLSIEELKRMQNMNIMELKREDLVNAEDIVIDTTKSVESRIRSFMEQTGNPFAMNVGEYILQIGFMEGAEDSIDDRMILLTKRKTQIMV